LGIVLLLPDLLQILVVRTIRQRHVLLVPAVIAGFIAAQQKNRRAARIEDVQNPVRPSLVL